MTVIAAAASAAATEASRGQQRTPHQQTADACRSSRCDQLVPTPEVQRQKKKTFICSAMTYGRQFTIMTLRRPMTLIVLGILWNSGVSGGWSSVQRRKLSADDTMPFNRDDHDADSSDQLDQPTTRGTMVSQRLI